jgi:ParB-like chromosome segregation protein Spo0J
VRGTELKVNPEYEALLPKLSKEEYEALKESIRKDGQHYPIIINKEGVILDGHHRLKACRDLGVTPRFEVREYHEDDKFSEREFVITTNLYRRHLNDFQRGELGYQLYLIEKERARQRRLAGVSIKSQETSSSFELEVGQARDVAAKKVHLSPTTFQRLLVIIERGSEELKEKCRTKELTIAQAYKKIIQQERRKKFWESTSGILPKSVQLFNSDFAFFFYIRLIQI